MIHEILPVGPLQCNCSILGDETTREAMVVDPGDDIPRILLALARHRLTVKQIVVTHAHIDHIAGAQELKRITGAPIFYNQLDLPLVAMMDQQAGWLGIPTPQVKPPDADLADGATVSIAGLSANVLHTPGHTPGSVCLHLPEQNLLIAGDTLFAGSKAVPTCPEATPEPYFTPSKTASFSFPTLHELSPAMDAAPRLVQNGIVIHFCKASLYRYLPSIASSRTLQASH